MTAVNPAEQGQGELLRDPLGSADSQRHGSQERHNQAHQRHPEREGHEYDPQQRDSVNATTFVRDPDERCIPLTRKGPDEAPALSSSAHAPVNLHRSNWPGPARNRTSRGRSHSPSFVAACAQRVWQQSITPGERAAVSQCHSVRDRRRPSHRGDRSPLVPAHGVPAQRRLGLVSNDPGANECSSRNALARIGPRVTAICPCRTRRCYSRPQCRYGD